jgi:hypothetical protein
MTPIAPAPCCASPGRALSVAAVVALLLAVQALSPAAAGEAKAAPLPPAAAPAATDMQPTSDGKPDASTIADAAGMARFLDRLMLAESGGRDTARNPRSTAYGPFQFIERTFLDVARRHFSAETAKLTPAATLAMRTDRAFARRAAEAYTRDNAAVLAEAGLAPTFANLRLAFLVGSGGAVRVLKAEEKTPVICVLGAAVVQANPFMAGMNAAGLIAWSARNLADGVVAAQALANVGSGPVKGGAKAKPRPQIAIRCNEALASCRRWVSLAKQRVERKVATAGADKRVRR